MKIHLYCYNAKDNCVLSGANRNLIRFQHNYCCVVNSKETTSSQSTNRDTNRSAAFEQLKHPVIPHFLQSCFNVLSSVTKVDFPSLKQAGNNDTTEMRNVDLWRR
jgi:hypothetical protein